MTTRILVLATALAALGCGNAAATGDLGGEAANAVTGGTGAASGACTTDADCVPATCCHPTACVDKSLAPDCSDTMCSAECAPGTLDCGQGSCRCNQGSCGAEISPASPPVDAPQ